MKRVLGLDIGGANLKLAHTDETATVVPFELWKQPDHLPLRLGEMIDAAPAFDAVAVTMTGELCDCFESRSEGVQFILDAVEKALPGFRLCIWCNDGRFVDVAAARGCPLQVASANWLALASWCGRLAPKGSALLIDIGSTTTDIIPLLDGVPNPQGRTDADRLRTGELLYRGVKRTPVPWTLKPGLAAEVFATMHDVFLITGNTPEDEQDCGTADGRPSTRRFAHARLARMLGDDGETCPKEATYELANQAVAAMIDDYRAALTRVYSHMRQPPQTIIVSGSGEWLARILTDTKGAPGPATVSLGEHLGPKLSCAACAYAVAVLMAERGDGK